MRCVRKGEKLQMKMGNCNLSKKHTTVSDCSIRCPFRKLFIITATVFKHAIKIVQNINQGENHYNQKEKPMPIEKGVVKTKK